MQTLSCPVASSFAAPLGRANAGALLLVLVWLEHCRIGLYLCVPALLADCEGMGCVQEGIAKLNPVYQGHATCNPLLPRLLVQLRVSVPTWNQKQRFLDSGVTAVTNFKPRSQNTRSQENFNESGFLIWTKGRALPSLRNGWDVFGQKITPSIQPKEKSNMGNVTLDK